MGDKKLRQKSLLMEMKSPWLMEGHLQLLVLGNIRSSNLDQETMLTSYLGSLFLMYRYPMVLFMLLTKFYYPHYSFEHAPKFALNTISKIKKLMEMLYLQ